jgi:hypothetical protein
MFYRFPTYYPYPDEAYVLQKNEIVKSDVSRLKDA